MKSLAIAQMLLVGRKAERNELKSSLSVAGVFLNVSL